MSSQTVMRASMVEYSLGETNSSEERCLSHPPMPRTPRFTTRKISNCDFPRCKGTSDTGSFCNICECLYCDDCWDLAPSHKKNRTRRTHEKTDETLAKTVSEILDPEQSNINFNDQVAEDEKTKWFGIKYPDNAEDPSSSITLFNTRRLQEIMDAAEKPNGEPQYPSIISFVGETGAGKSTLIKALIEVK